MEREEEKKEKQAIEGRGKRRERRGNKRLQQRRYEGSKEIRRRLKAENNEDKQLE